MSLAQAARCDICSVTAPVISPRTHPDGWFIVFGPAGRAALCSPACMSAKYRPHVTTGFVDTLTRGSYLGGAR